MLQYFSSLVLVLILLTGCTTTRKLEVAPPVQRSDSEIYSALAKHNYDFSWFSGEASISLNSPDQSVAGKAYIRMRKDSVLWSVVKKSGVEGGRLLVTPSMYAGINRLEGTYTRGQSAEVLSSMGVTLDFYDIQQAIFGNLIIPEDNTYSVYKVSDRLYNLSFISGEFSLAYSIDAATLAITHIVMQSAAGQQIDISMSDYKPLASEIQFAYKRTYIIKDARTGTTEIKLNYKKVEVDKVKSLKFSIPPHYEEIK